MPWSLPKNSPYTKEFNYGFTGKIFFANFYSVNVRCQLNWINKQNGNFLHRIGLLKMREGGLTDIWLTWYKADASKCIGIVHQKRPTFKPLTLVNMSNAGLVLLVGYCVSFIVLTCENIFCFLRNMKKCNDNLHASSSSTLGVSWISNTQRLGSNNLLPHHKIYLTVDTT